MTQTVRKILWGTQRLRQCILLDERTTEVWTTDTVTDFGRMRLPTLACQFWLRGEMVIGNVHWRCV